MGKVPHGPHPHRFGLLIADYATGNFCSDTLLKSLFFSPYKKVRCSSSPIGLMSYP
jgi:hypothetical protein